MQFVIQIYLTVVINLFFRSIVCWSIHNRQPTDLALQALLKAVWRRKPTRKFWHILGRDQPPMRRAGRDDHWLIAKRFGLGF
jgi:transposase InsO family protein